MFTYNARETGRESEERDEMGRDEAMRSEEEESRDQERTEDTDRRAGEEGGSAGMSDNESRYQ